MQATSRREHIAARLRHHWLVEVGAAISEMPRDEWIEHLDSLGCYARFGFGSPAPWSDPPLVVPFQADLIAEVTDHLSDRQLSDYLDAIETVWDVAIAHILEEGMPADQAVTLAESELYLEFKGSLVLMSETQAAAIDRGVRP